MTYSPKIDRNTLMAAMRREGIPDSVTAKVIGLSRERVRQILGNASDDKTAWAAHCSIVFDRDELEREIRSGKHVAAIGEKFNVSGEFVSRKISEFGLLDVYREAKRATRYKLLKDRLIEFAAHLKRLGRAEYDTCDLIAYDTSLYSLASRTGYLVEWSRELGLYYTTGEKRRLKGTDDGVEERLEQRRRI